MKKFVPFDKMSKKKQKEFLKSKRKAPIPAPRVVPDKHKDIRDEERFASHAWARGLV